MLYVAIIILCSIGIGLLILVLALQLGLTRWGVDKSKFTVTNMKSKKEFNFPIIWTISNLLVLNIIQLVLTSLWHGDNFYLGYDGLIFCDIVIRVQAFASISVMCGVTAVCIHLSNIVRPKGPPSYYYVVCGVRWKKHLVDILLCTVFPIIQNPIIYLVQVRRYMIAENMGCIMVVSDSWMSLLVYHIWFAIWPVIAAIYAFITGFYYFKRRIDFADLLVTTQSNMTEQMFFQMMIFSVIIICGELPVSLYVVVSRVQATVWEPYSFKVAHSYFNMIGFALYQGVKLMDRWLFIVFSYVAFFAFGRGTDARKVYMKFLDKIHLGWVVRDTQSFFKNKFGKKKHQTPGPNQDNEKPRNLTIKANNPLYENGLPSGGVFSTTSYDSNMYEGNYSFTLNSEGSPITMNNRSPLSPSDLTKNMGRHHNERWDLSKEEFEFDPSSLKGELRLENDLTMQDWNLFYQIQKEQVGIKTSASESLSSGSITSHSDSSKKEKVVINVDSCASSSSDEKDTKETHN